MPVQRRSLILTLLLFAFVVAGCGASATSPMAYDSASPRESGEEAGFAPANTAAQTDLPATAERLIVRTADLSLVVQDPAARAAEIAALAEELGGWVVQNNTAATSSETGSTRSTVTIRVPADRFDEALNTIKRDAVEVRYENVTGEDVTEEFVDLSARLTNLEATQARVRGFLDEARTVEDALNVNRELSRLEEEIERLKGRMGYLQRSAAFSGITVSLVADADTQPIEIGGWRPQGTARAALQTLINLLQFLVDVAIWLVIVGLPLVLILAGVRWVWRRLAGAGLLPALRWPRRRVGPKQ